MCALVVVSFFDYDSVRIIPAVEFANYTDVLGSAVTWRIYRNTFRYTVIVWAVAAMLGCSVAYVLAFKIRSRTTQMVLFLVCTVPLLTTNIIRMRQSFWPVVLPIIALSVIGIAWFGVTLSCDEFARTLLTAQ
jgi:putative spermidine/putrescine transport system permease protein